MSIQRRQFRRPDHAAWPLPPFSQHSQNTLPAHLVFRNADQSLALPSCMMGDLVLLLNVVAAPFARLQRFSEDSRQLKKLLLLLPSFSAAAHRGLLGSCRGGSFAY